MAEIEKTPTLGLNKPPKGYFDWDVPLNENWDKLDFLGAGQLPLLTPMMFDHRLEGDEALGWAMQGSTLDGSEYTSVWEKLKKAKDRAVQQTWTIKSVTYTVFKDKTSGWVFLDQANYNKAFTNLKDSLGFVLTDVDGKKTIILPKREVYSKPSMSDANIYGSESLPNIKGTFNIDTETYSGRASGAFYESSTANVLGVNAPWNKRGLGFNASRASSTYQDGAKVNPDYHTVFIYYKVGNTIVDKEEIDLGNLTSQVDNLATNKANKDLSNVSSNIDYVIEQGSNYIKFKSKKLIQWGFKTYTTTDATTVTFVKPFANTSYILAGVPYGASGVPDYTLTTKGKKTTSFVFKIAGYAASYGMDWIAIGQGA